MAPPAIRTSGLTKDFGGGRGVFDLELQVSAHESFALIGPADSGKSTAIRLLMGALRPTRGSAYVFGLDCVREAVEVKRRVGYLPGRMPEFGSMRGAEVTTYLAALRGGVHRDRVRELAERFDLDLGRRHRDYNKAERQKLAIILAFMPEPDLLLLDEPWENLDARSIAELHGLIEEARDEQATIFLASRTAAQVERHCDVAGILRRGKLSRVMRIEDLPLELGERSQKALPP